VLALGIHTLVYPLANAACYSDSNCWRAVESEYMPSHVTYAVSGSVESVTVLYMDIEKVRVPAMEHFVALATWFWWKFIHLPCLRKRSYWRSMVVAIPSMNGHRMLMLFGMIVVTMQHW
jgi:hypothetical protein